MNIGLNYKYQEAEIGKFSTSDSDSVVAGLGDGQQIIGLTMGNFSLIDLIYSTLKKVGPSAVYIATWSAGIKDAQQVKWMVDSGLIQGVRLLTDVSYKGRQPKYAMSITDLFGEGNIRTSKMHAKFVLIKNEEYEITIISSMNLNANKTCETYQIYSDNSVYKFYKSFVDTHFDDVQAGFDSSFNEVAACAKRWFDADENDKKPAKSRHWSNAE